jgi:hypothetical protein
MSAGMNACTCGHAPEDHGGDKENPGSTACVECECIAYEEIEDEE